MPFAVYLDIQVLLYQHLIFSEYKEALEASKIPVRDIFYRPREDDNGKPYFEVPYLALETFAAELKRARWSHHCIFR